MNYEEVVEYISSIPRFTKKTELANTEKILARLGDPTKIPQAIHIAGTNGKGSVAKMMSLYLADMGYKTGLFISPHLVKMNERISINGTDISDDEMVHIFSIIKNTIDEMLSEQGSGDGTGEGIQHPAYFEFLFLMAAVYFREQECDYVVYETGLGGRLDATSVVEPSMTIITSIGMDHMQYLGDTIEEIAWEKAGIIRPFVPVIYNTGNLVADEIIVKRANELYACPVNVVECVDDIRRSLTKAVRDRIDSFSALYQRDNAYTFIEATIMLGLGSKRADEIDYNVNRHLADTFDSFYWPGRMEFVKENVIIDGAHNEDAILRCIESVKYICQEKGFKKVSILFAVSSDKDYESIIRTLSKRLNSDGIAIEDVYVSELDSDRREDSSVVVSLFQKYLPAEKQFDVVGTKNIERAWELANGELTDDTLLLVVGSLYMVGEIKRKTGDGSLS